MKTVPAKTLLQKNKTSDWFGNDYNMNLYRGCCHGCIYCDSRSECYHVEDFDTVHAKENALIILRDELRRKIRSGIIGTGAMSDPYNPFEKSELITRDIDLYKEISEHSPVLCKMTVTTTDDSLAALLEPNVSPPSERFDALAKMAESGLFTGITLMPTLPFITDSVENIRNIVRIAHQCGVRCIYPWFGVTLRTNQRDHFLRELDRRFPKSGLRQRYENFYGSRYECASPNSRELWRIFTEECEKFGIIYNMKSIISAYKMGYGDMQLKFF